jgi:hypothetical protein
MPQLLWVSAVEVAWVTYLSIVANEKEKKPAKGTRHKTHTDHPKVIAERLDLERGDDRRGSRCCQKYEWMKLIHTRAYVCACKCVYACLCVCEREREM